jgi:multicomponent Na+:H+ antiporter subunit G
MNIHEIIGSIFVLIGLVIQLFGIYGIFKYEHFYVRLTLSSLIDSAGLITIIIGLILYKGFGFATLKLGFILLLMLLLNPLSNHILGRGAFLSNYHPERQGEK